MPTLCAAYTPPFPFGTASGHIKYEGASEPVQTGKKFDLSVRSVWGIFLTITKEGLKMNLMSPFKLSPAFKDYLWGGRKLVTDFNKSCDFEKVAESWELSTHKDGSSIIANGEFSGMTFIDYIEKYGKDVLGKNALAFDFFPILIKFIDAKDSLSIQVHPDDEYALKVEGEYGKTEMWYILDCEDGASLYYGFNREITKDEFLERINNNTILEVLNAVPVKKGDVFFIDSGTVHAIGAGIVICEIQQNSNTTYRVYDYDRKDKFGNRRELHIEKAADVSVLKPASPTVPYSDPEILAECKYFNVRKSLVNGSRTFVTYDDCFTSVIVVNGTGTLVMNDTEIKFSKGDSIFIPAQNSEFTVTGDAELIISRV